MKIGLVIYGSLDTMSGGYLYDRKLVAYLRRQGDTVEVVSLPWRNYFAHLSDNFRFRLPANFDALIEDELNHPSLLIANSGPHPCPVIGLVHNLRSAEPRPGWQNAFYRLVEQRYLNSVDGFIFNSATTREAVHALVEADKPRLVATPGGDRLGSLSPDAIRARAAGPGPLRLLFLANVTPLKGLHVLLEAMVKEHTTLRAQSSAFSLDVVGSPAVDSKYAKEMQRFAVVNGLSSMVRFHGILDGRALIEKLKQAQVLVVPSSYEGFGISYLEGMAFGLPVIGTTAGAIPQLITDGENGYLITPGDSVTLAKRLRGLASDRGLLVRLSLNARKRFDEFPTWDQAAGSIRDFLLQMITSK
jgi:glycosyltransferase involved in cell wall biosynthesis